MLHEIFYICNKTSTLHSFKSLVFLYLYKTGISTKKFLYLPKPVIYKISLYLPKTEILNIVLCLFSENAVYGWLPKTFSHSLFVKWWNFSIFCFSILNCLFFFMLINIFYHLQPQPQFLIILSRWTFRHFCLWEKKSTCKKLMLKNGYRFLIALLLSLIYVTYTIHQVMIFMDHSRNHLEVT